MNMIEVQERLTRMQRELKLAGEEAEAKLLELRVEIDRMKIEMAALKTFLEKANPSFAEEFPGVLERAVAEVDPEFEKP